VNRFALVLSWIVIAAVAFAIGRQTAPSQQAGDEGPIWADVMEASLREALHSRDLLDGVSEVTRLMRDLRPENVTGAIAAFDSQRASEFEIQLFATAWARIDAPSALEHLLGWPRNTATTAVPAAVEAWAAENPAAARQFVAGLDEGWLREPCARALATGWALSGEPGLAEHLSAIPSHRLRQKVVNHMMWSWLKREPANAVMDWVDSIEGPDEFKRMLYEKALSQIAQQDPPLAAAWVDAHVGGAYSRRAPRLVLAPWLRIDTPAALVWLESLPAGPQRDESLEWGFLRWMTQDRERAEAWIRGVEITPALWPAIQGFARRWVESDPVEALIWCERISDLDRSQLCQADIAGSWFNRDPEAARSWIAGSQLPAELVRFAEPRRPQPNRSRTAHPDAADEAS
jgi:hypothetical protein